MEPDFIRACRGEVVDHVPVWFMRQAGRALPEYRALRATGSILDAIANPERRLPKSRCSRCAATGSTRRFSSRTSSCPITPLTSASTSYLVAAPLLPSPSPPS